MNIQNNTFKKTMRIIVSITHNFLMFTFEQHTSTIRSTDKSMLTIMKDEIKKGDLTPSLITYMKRPIIYT